MNFNRWKVCVVMALLSTVGATMAQESTLRVMSFNVRYGTAPDGENRWEKRRELVAATIRRFDPDLLGTQETLELQADFLRSQFPAYTHFGVGRDDGHSKGEQAAIFFRTDRFEKMDAGHFWLSEHPDQPGSKGWDADCVRMVTWAKLRDRRAAGRTLLWLNTHWDHRGTQARLESPKVMRLWLADHGQDLPLIITGDFNSTEDSPQYRTLLGDNPKLTDSYRQVHAERKSNEGSFHGFEGKQDGSRIDWILSTADFTPVEAEIDHSHKDGRYPSDHFPVTALFRWGAR